MEAALKKQVTSQGRGTHGEYHKDEKGGDIITSSARMRCTAALASGRLSIWNVTGSTSPSGLNIDLINGPMLPIGRKVVPLSYDCVVGFSV